DGQLCLSDVVAGHRQRRLRQDDRGERDPTEKGIGQLTDAGRRTGQAKRSPCILLQLRRSASAPEGHRVSILGPVQTAHVRGAETEALRRRASAMVLGPNRHCASLLFVHYLSGEPVPTFPDHTLPYSPSIRPACDTTANTEVPLPGVIRCMSAP